MLNEAARIADTTNTIFLHGGDPSEPGVQALEKRVLGTAQAPNRLEVVQMEDDEISLRMLEENR